MSVDGKDASVELRTGPIQRLAEISTICNDAKIIYDEVGFLLKASYVLSVLTGIVEQELLPLCWRARGGCTPRPG